MDHLPRPLDEPERHSPGPDPDRVLIFGGGPAVGWGVLSHEIGLTGALGRVLSRRTHRGANIHARPIPRLKIASVLGELGKIDIDGYDAVVLTLGINDAGALTPISSWDRGLRALLRSIGRTSPDVRVFVAGVHPIRSIPVYDSFLGSVAESHARKMNAISAGLCEQAPNATYVPLTAPESSGALRFRDAASYRHWAEELAKVMSPLLDARSRCRFTPALERLRSTEAVAQTHIRREPE